MALPRWLRFGAGSAPASQTQVLTFTEDLRNPQQTKAEKEAFEARVQQMPLAVHLISLRQLHSPDTRTFFATNDPRLREELFLAAVKPKHTHFAKAVSILAQGETMGYDSMRSLRQATARMFDDDRRLSLGDTVLARLTEAKKRLTEMMQGKEVEGFGTIARPALPKVVAFQARLAALDPSQPASPENVAGVGLLGVAHRARMIAQDIAEIDRPVGVRSAPEEAQPKPKLAEPARADPARALEAAGIDVAKLKALLAKSDAPATPASSDLTERRSRASSPVVVEHESGPHVRV